MNPGNSPLTAASWARSTGLCRLPAEHIPPQSSLSENKLRLKTRNWKKFRNNQFNGKKISTRKLLFLIDNLTKFFSAITNDRFLTNLCLHFNPSHGFLDKSNFRYLIMAIAVIYGHKLFLLWLFRKRAIIYCPTALIAMMIGSTSRTIRRTIKLN